MIIHKTNQTTTVSAYVETELARYDLTYNYQGNRLNTLNANVTDLTTGVQIGSINLSEPGYVSSSIRSDETARFVAEVEAVIAQLKTEIETNQ